MLTEEGVPESGLKGEQTQVGVLIRCEVGLKIESITFPSIFEYFTHL